MAPRPAIRFQTPASITMNRPLSTALLLLSASAAAAAGLDSFRGLWNFDGTLNARFYCQGPATATGFTPAYAAATIGAQPATALDLPVLTGTQKFAVPNSGGVNGGPGATRTNQWTLVMDVKFTTLTGFAGLIQTNPANTDDEDAWVTSAGTLFFGNTLTPPGSFVVNTWYRLALTAENDGAGGPLTLRAYRNGVPFATTASSTFNGTHSLSTSLLLFTDNNAETQPVQLNAAGLWATTLSAADIASLGGPDAAGLTGAWVVDPCVPGSTADAAQHFAWAPNAGWLNGNWDTAAANGGKGLVVSPWICSGQMWAENFGWLDWGAGSPAGGVRYAQSAGDFGVNHDGAGSLYGWAWSGNIGWVYFGKHPNARPTDRWPQAPSLGVLTGNLHGYAWSGNAGWIQLGASSASSRLITRLNWCGPDTDSDGIPDTWETERLSAAARPLNLATLGAATDSDSDGDSDLKEYAADTNPFDSTDRLAFLTTTFAPPQATLTWRSRSTRSYSVRSSPQLQSWAVFAGPLAGTGANLSATGNVSGPRHYFTLRATPWFCQ